uniref:glycosyltransferase family 4 protein n=1 Tax=Desulfurobacterium sp. TaxID=2004706 RepID=UPI0026273BBC
MKVKAIHQFHSGSAYGDAVTNGMLLIRDILRKLGFKSEIYVEHVDRKLKKELKHYSQYKTDPENVLLVHHSLGHDLDSWLKSLKDKIVLVYHNITPERFFPEDSLLRKYARKGREQLKLLKEISVAAIADSKVNKQELISLGFLPEKVWVIPLLFDLEKIRNHPYNPRIIDKYGTSFNVLFVGRVVGNKKQDELVDIFSYFKKLSDKPSRLILVGGTTDLSYERLVKDKVKKYGLKLGEDVLLTGRIPYKDLYAYYRCADVFVCMSEHEGFGVPLVEAFALNVPVVAYDAPDSNVRYTLNGGGVLVKEKDFKKIAALLSVLSKNRRLLREILKTQEEAISVYEKDNIIEKFVNFLEKIVGVEIPKDYETVFSKEFKRKDVDFQIEGPFDSSYSLAIVNREMARALNSLFPEKVALYSTEGPGDFEPNKEFLINNPDVEIMWKKGEKGYRKGTLLRNLYPPRVSDMKSYINLMNSYGWEESEFPKEYLKNFNRYLDALPVMSPYVKKIMIDNGITIPVFSIGLGVDHVLKVKPKYYSLKTKKNFKFLHISSCFPRKGIDVLLDAYTSAFTAEDDVVLIIKTFPNPHNNVEELVEKFKEKGNAPEIEVINKDLPDNYIVGLYKQCDCLVQPTRGEGFGLPMAEAMLFELPVITTAFGGQTFFCREDNSWLVDFRFSKARTHMKQFNSYWVEPEKESLIKAMREVYTLSEEKKREKTQKAKQFVLENFTWEKSAKKLLKVRDYVEKLPIFPDRKLRVGWVSTWNTRCGIATYSQFLTENFSEDVDLFIIADKVSSKEILKPELEKNVYRIWSMGGKSADIDKILNFVIGNSLDSVVFQYNFGFIDIR